MPHPFTRALACCLVRTLLWRAEHLLDLLAQAHQAIFLGGPHTGVQRYHSGRDCKMIVHREILVAQKQTMGHLCSNLRDMNTTELSR